MNYGPIDAHTFDDCLARGFGRVIPFLRERDARPFRESILYACGRDLAYDRQCEDTREVYHVDILEATGEIDFYVPRILDMLRSDDDELSYYCLYHLAAELAKRGYVEARQAMYDQYRVDFEHGDVVGDRGLLELDGVQGLLFILRAVMKYPDRPKPEMFSEYLFLDEAYDRDGVEHVVAVLDEAGKEDQKLGEYLRRIDVEWREWRRKLRNRDDDGRVMTYEKLRSLIDNPDVSRKQVDWTRRGKVTTGVALRRIADELGTEADVEKQIKIVSLFRRCEFKGDLTPLFEFVISSNENLKHRARWDLQQVDDERIRQFALDLIRSRTDLLSGLDILHKSGRPEDFPLFAEILAEDHSDDDFHSIGIDIRWVIENNPTPDAAPILETLYERGRCSMCRYATVARMIDCEVLPDWIRNEGQFDAETGVRDLVGKAAAA